jgi:hypothetical protein
MKLALASCYLMMSDEEGFYYTVLLSSFKKNCLMYVKLILY